MKYLIVVFFILNINFYSLAQCSISGATLPTSSTCSGTIAADGNDITGGATQYHSATSGVFGTFTITQGTLRVCGTLTITNLILNSSGSPFNANIIIEKGGSLTISNALTIGNYEGFRVYGNLTFNSNVTFNNTAAYILIEADRGKVTTAASTILTVSNANNIINRGQLFVNGTLTFSNPSTMCVENNSFASIHTLNINGQTNPVIYEPVAGSGNATFNISNSFTGSGTFTNNSRVKLCNNGCTSVNGCGTVGNSNTWNNAGSADRYTSACSNPLPVVFGNIKATKQNNSTEIKWTTLQELNNDYFIVEKSNNGVIFESISKVKGVGNSNVPLSYNTEDFGNTEGITYYRIKQVDKNGDFEYSKIFTLTDEYSKGFLIYPNPVDNGLTQLFLENHSNGHIYVIVYSDLGQIISSGDINVAEGEIVDVFAGLHNLASGIYEVKITTNSEVHVEKIVVK